MHIGVIEVNLLIREDRRFRARHATSWLDNAQIIEASPLGRATKSITATHHHLIHSAICWLRARSARQNLDLTAFEHESEAGHRDYDGGKRIIVFVDEDLGGRITVFNPCAWHLRHPGKDDRRTPHTALSPLRG